MLEAPSYLVSKDLPIADEEAKKLIHNAHCVLQFELKNRLLNVTDEEGSARKILKANPRSRDGSEKVKNILLDPKTYQWSSQSHQGGDQQQPPIAQVDSNTLLNCLAHCSISDFGSIALTNRILRSFTKSNELYRLRRSKGLVEHWIYFSCNLNEWQAYDPNRDRWICMPKINSNQVFYLSDKESLAIGTHLLVFGKDISSPMIYRYNLLTNTWTSGMQMNFPRCLFGSACLGNIGIIAGGCDYHENKLLSSAEVYNSETGEWTVIPSMMNKARKMCSSVFMDEKYYVIGGIGEDEAGKSIMLKCGEVYDLKKKKWILIPNMVPEIEAGDQAMETHSGSPPLVAVVKDEIYVAIYVQREVRKYDKKCNAWIKVGNLPERTAATNGWGMAFRGCGDQLVVVGGPRSSVSGILEINACIPREGELLQWRLLVSKPNDSYVYNCAIMGC